MARVQPKPRQYVSRQKEQGGADVFKNPALKELIAAFPRFNFGDDRLQIGFKTKDSCHESRAIAVGKAMEECFKKMGITVNSAGVDGEGYLWVAVTNDVIRQDRLGSTLGKITQAVEELNAEPARKR